jgi:hypothetical protein
VRIIGYAKRGAGHHAVGGVASAAIAASVGRHHCQGDATGTAANGLGHMKVCRCGLYEGRLETNTGLWVAGDPGREWSSPRALLRGDVQGTTG